MLLLVPILRPLKRPTVRVISTGTVPGSFPSLQPLILCRPLQPKSQSDAPNLSELQAPQGVLLDQTLNDDTCAGVATTCGASGDAAPRKLSCMNLLATMDSVLGTIL